MRLVQNNLFEVDWQCCVEFYLLFVPTNTSMRYSIKVLLLFNMPSLFSYFL